jgi:hypothetical protein
MSDRRTGWLAELRIGDEVGVVDHSRWGPTAYGVARVESITPTGRLSVGGRSFGPDGSGWGSNAARLDRAEVVRPLAQAAASRDALTKAVDRLSALARDSSRIVRLTGEQADAVRAHVEAALVAAKT